MFQTAKVYDNAFLQGLKPDPLLTVSDWADEHRVLSKKASSEPGRWRTSRTPYLREIMDALSVTSPIKRVIFMKGSQVGGSECGNNWIGYIIHHAPGPIMSVQPTVELAKRNSRQRIGPLISECPALKDKVSEVKSRDSSNTVLFKEFEGGLLVMTGANSAVGLRSLPARYLFLDEVDAYPFDVDGEGDPVKLAVARQRTFSKKKEFHVSTPTIQGMSRIEKSYQESDQRRFFVPCPECNQEQWLKWSQVKWEKENPLGAWYECEHCQRKIENWEKTKMLARGRWIPTNENHTDKTTVGFHLSSLYSPHGWISWGELAKEWVEAQGKREALKTFVNTVLGETWAEKGDAPEWKRLYERREKYEINKIPSGVLFLTAGADVQKDRIEVEIVGWGRDKISWSIDYRVFPGDTSSLESESWQNLARLVSETWEGDEGIQLPLSRLAVDSGFNTQVVYSWVRQFMVTRVIAVKGNEGQQSLIAQPRSVDVTSRGKTLRRGLKVFQVGVDAAKSELYGWLKLSGPGEDELAPHGFCHFPEYSEEYFKQLTAEQLTIKIIRGFKRYQWEKKRERNEALDCRVYARAAASLVGLDRFKETDWERLESDVGVTNQRKDKSVETQKSVEKPEKKVTITRRKSNFL